MPPPPPISYQDRPDSAFGVMLMRQVMVVKQIWGTGRDAADTPVTIQLFPNRFMGKHPAVVTRNRRK